jgi:hypothetical protein
MESTSWPMCIQMSEQFFDQIDWSALKPQWRGAWHKYDAVAIKGKGLMTTYIASPYDASALPPPHYHDAVPSFPHVDPTAVPTSEEVRPEPR